MNCKLRVPLCVGALALVVVAACTEPSADVSAVVYGRITSTSGFPVPGATAIVELFADTARISGYPQPYCTGELVVPAVSQDLDAEGDYRVVVSGEAAAGTRVCVQVTGDPHGLYSDVGLKVHYGGWVELRRPLPDSVRVDVRYTETP